MQLNQGQLQAISSTIKFITSATERQMVIKGRAGTGKSTLIKELLSALAAHAKMVAFLLQSPSNLDIHLTATTNKAAKVMADFTGEQTVTIHSLLGLRIYNDYKTGNTKLVRAPKTDVISNAVIIIDEAFYIDNVLLKYIEEGTHNCKIIFIGDPYQCAPVRQTFSPIEKLTCRTEELTQVMRNSGVLTDIGEHWRDSVINSIFAPFTVASPHIVWASASEFKTRIEQEFLDPNVPETDNKIICWTNDQSSAYSQYVRKLRGLPDQPTVGEYYQIVNSLSKQGLSTDTIVQIKQFNNPATLSGITGRYAITDKHSSLFIPDSNHEYKQALKRLAAAKKWPEFWDLQNGVPDLRPIHGCTVHKAQGSTYKRVFIDLPDIGACNIASDVARMMHVAVTRPTEQIIFRGNLPTKYGG